MSFIFGNHDPPHFFHDYKRTAVTIKIVTVMSDQFNVFLLNKSIKNTYRAQTF